MTERISEAMLNAYLDGELSASETLRVELAIEADPGLQVRLRRLVETGAGLRAAYAEPLREDVPDRLVDAVESAFAARGRRSGLRPAWQRPEIAIAAGALAAMVLLLVGGLATLDMTVEQRLAEERQEEQADKLALEMAIQDALETNTSGDSEVWQAPQRRLAGTVTPVRTFRNTEGRWCREYLQRIDAGGRHEGRQGIACRDGDGIWRTRLETYLES